MGGVLSPYSYIAPLLTERAGLPADAVPLALVGFGAGSLIGSILGPDGQAGADLAGRALRRQRPHARLDPEHFLVQPRHRRRLMIAGLALESHLQELGPPIVGTVIASLTLIPLTLLARPSLAGDRRTARKHAPQPTAAE